MKLFLAAIAISTILYALPSHAGTALSINRDPNGHLIMSGPSCELIAKQIAALKAWRKKTNEPASPADPACQCDKGNCSERLDTVAPEIVSELQGTTPLLPGPNCWNSTLVADKIEPTLRYSTDNEFSFWLQSPLCHELGSHEKPVPGDIIAIREQPATEVHGFIYLTDELAFTKNGSLNSSPYQLQSPQDILAMYSVPAGCERRSGTVQSDCPTYANYFRCETLEEYSHHHAPANAKLRLALFETRMAECHESQIAFAPMDSTQRFSTSTKAIREMGIAVLALKALALNRSELKQLHPEDRLWWKYLVVSLDAINIQAIEPYCADPKNTWPLCQLVR